MICNRLAGIEQAQAVTRRTTQESLAHIAPLPQLPLSSYPRKQRIKSATNSREHEEYSIGQDTGFVQ